MNLFRFTFLFRCVLAFPCEGLSVSPSVRLSVRMRVFDFDGREYRKEVAGRWGRGRGWEGRDAFEVWRDQTWFPRSLIFVWWFIFAAGFSLIYTTNVITLWYVREGSVYNGTISDTGNFVVSFFSKQLKLEKTFNGISSSANYTIRLQQYVNACPCKKRAMQCNTREIFKSLVSVF